MTGRRVIDTIAAMTDWPATPDARYSLLGHTHAIYALLSHAHAGEDITSGTVASDRIAASLTGKTLVTPTIASFTNAQHNHADAAGGGTISGGGGTPGGADTYVQFNDAGVLGGVAGFNFVKATNVLSVTGRLVTPIWRPSADSVTAIKIQNAAGTEDLLTVNTSQHNIVLGSPTADTMELGLYSDGRADFRIYSTGSTSGWMGFYVNGGNYASAYGEFGFLNNASNQVASINFDTRSGVAPFRFFVGPAGGAQVDAMDIFANGYIGIGTSNVQATALFQISAGTTARAPLRLVAGVAPTSPNNGDVWFDGTDFKARVGGVTKTFTLT